jgi:hypothetical protein
MRKWKKIIRNFKDTYIDILPKHTAVFTLKIHYLVKIRKLSRNLLFKCFKKLRNMTFNWFVLRNALQKKLPISRSSFLYSLKPSTGPSPYPQESIPQPPIQFTLYTFYLLSSQLRLLPLGSLRDWQTKFQVNFDKSIFQVFRIYA